MAISRTSERRLECSKQTAVAAISRSTLANFHNAVATPVVFGSLVDNVTIQGVRIFAIDPRFAAPGLDPASHLETMGSSNRLAQEHPRPRQLSRGLLLALGNRLRQHHGPHLAEHLVRVRLSVTVLVAIRVRAEGRARFAGVNWQIFGPDADLSKNGNDPYVYVDDQTFSGSDAFEHKDRIDLTDTNVNYGYPAGVTEDPTSAQNSPQNPAGLWRASHPDDSWPAFFGWTVTRSATNDSPTSMIAAVAAVGIVLVATAFLVFLRRRRPGGPGNPFWWFPVRHVAAGPDPTQVRGAGLGTG